MRAGTFLVFLGLASETRICNNLTAKVLLNALDAICASLKLTDLISLRGEKLNYKSVAKEI